MSTGEHRFSFDLNRDGKVSKWEVALILALGAGVFIAASAIVERCGG